MAEKRTRNWTFVFYPESTREDWAEVLGEKGLQLCVSPLHDKDVYTKDVFYTRDEGDHKAGELKHAAGDVKKPHYHAVIVFDSVKSRDQVQDIAQMIAAPDTKAPAVQYCMNLRGSMRYLAHIDNPEKAQYDTNEILTFGGIDWAYYAMSQADIEADVRTKISQILGLMTEYKISTFCNLVDCVLEQAPELFDTLRKNAYFIGMYLKGKFYIENPLTEEEEKI